MENDDVLNNGVRQENGNPLPENRSGDSSDLDKPADTSQRKILSERKPGGFLRFVLFLVATVVFAIIAIWFVLYAVPWLTELNSGHKTIITGNKELRQSASYKKQIAQITKDIQRVSRKYSAYTSGQSYIIINTTGNRFYLYRNKKLLREGFCSSGSYTMLQTAGNKKWVFKTPKGKYWIQGKTTNPVWKKPDWAFVEEGLPIPPKDDFSRYEAGVLGDYALSIGDGYMIHGTIYKRFLGMPVTHGCVRLNDEDLEVIYNTLNIGSKVYIF
jgi:lipoprotein-anchoring transpeptidase ErfK/SrfK